MKTTIVTKPSKFIVSISNIFTVLTNRLKEKWYIQNLANSYIYEYYTIHIHFNKILLVT